MDNNKKLNGNFSFFEEEYFKKKFIKYLKWQELGRVTEALKFLKLLHKMFIQAINSA